MVIRNNIILLIFFAATLWCQEPSEKCGTFRYVQSLNQAKRLRIKIPAVTRPVLQKSILTRNQKIRIHYDTAGINLPAMVDAAGSRIPNSTQTFIDTLRILLDSVWNAEINTYGFTEPPADDNRGGGNEYDFYVMDLSSGLFGETVIETDLPIGTTKTNQQYSTYIRIDNDFGAGYRTKGIPAVMATSAHEFHHAIQVSGSGVWEDDQFYFYELCAEAMENTVFRDARDYIFDARTYFANISSIPLFVLRSQSSYAGYERAIWGMFLMKKYTPSIMKEIWSSMISLKPVPSLTNALNKYSSSLQREYSDFSFWNFFTAHRADSIRYYPDAKLLPSIDLTRTFVASPSVQEFSITSKSFVSNYFKIYLSTDTSLVVVSNTNYDDLLSDGQKLLTSKLTYSSSASSGFPAISRSIYASFSAADPQYWSYIPLGSKSLSSCFPNPLNPSTSSLLISLDGIGSATDVTLSILSANDMDLVYSNNALFTAFSGTIYAEWKGRDNNGKMVPSGIYLYILSKGSTVVKGKFAVIR